MNIQLVDKLSLDNIEDLISRDKHLRIVINNKIYDTSHEDDLAKIIINDNKYKNMLLIRYEYLLSKIYHGMGKGDIVLYDNVNNLLYAIELKSLKDKYTNMSDKLKIEKCISQSIKYAQYTNIWALKESIAVAIIEHLDGTLQIVENRDIAKEWPKEIPKEIFKEIPKEMSKEILDYKNNICYLDDEDILYLPNSKINHMYNQLKKEIEEINNDKWFSHPGDQTLTKYKINGDTLESERIIDYSPSPCTRRSFRKRVKRVCQESTKCTKYICTMKDVHGNILMQEFHEINDIII